jgi:hypothetical protein
MELTATVANDKLNVVAFIGGAALNIARMFGKLPAAHPLSKAMNIKILVIGDYTYSHDRSRLPISDCQFLLSESFAWSRFHPLNDCALENYPISQQIALARSELEALRMTMRNSYENLIVVAGLGGQTGTFAGAALAEMALEERIPTSRILVAPFKWESARNGLAEKVIAFTSRESLRDKVLPNQDAYTELDRNTFMPVAIDYLNKRASTAVMTECQKIFA